jgi:hypothetical protein
VKLEFSKYLNKEVSRRTLASGIKALYIFDSLDQLYSDGFVTRIPNLGPSTRGKAKSLASLPKIRNENIHELNFVGRANR